MKKPLSHLHERSYWGEFDAGPLIEWLNRKDRPARDPIEKLVRLNSELAMRESRPEIYSIVSSLVRRSKLAVAPVVGEVSRDSWDVDWRMVGNMAPAQGLAFVKLLHLAARGLLGRVRQCPAQGCGRWFFARFSHQGFHALPCQQRTFRADPVWKKKHAEQMRQLRHEKKLQEQRWLRETKRKGRQK